MTERLPTSLPEVTPRQREVARLVAEGLTNEEIAARLDISLAGAKYHVSELLGRLGAERRDEIAEWYRRGGPERPRPWLRWQRVAIAFAAGALGAAAIVALATGVPLGGGTGEDGALPAPAGGEVAYRAYSAQELRDAGLVEFGPFIDADGPVEIHMRSGLVALRAPGGATVSTRAPSGGVWVVNGCCGLAGAMHLERGASDEWLWVVLYSNDRRLARVVGAPPPVALVVGEADGGTEHFALEVRRGGWTSAGRQPLAVAVDERGHLFLGEDPIDLAPPTEMFTSERLDVSRATRLGSLRDAQEIDARRAQTATRCLDRDVCEGWYEGYLPLLAPMDGEVVCVQPGTFELRSASATLRFTMPEPLCPARAVSTVREGDAIPFDPLSASMTIGWLSLSLSAVDAAGTALDVAVGGDGTVYLGAIEAHVGCPCRVFN